LDFINSADLQLAIDNADSKDLCESIAFSMFDSAANKILDALMATMAKIPKAVERQHFSRLPDAEKFKIEKLQILIENLEKILNVGLELSDTLANGERDFYDEISIEEVLTKTHSTVLRERFKVAKPLWDAFMHR
jgi:hypothetical protein